LLEKIRNSDLARSVMVLTTGTVFAQSIGYLITPLLTRIYTTEEMGDLGVYIRVIGFLSTLATLRYELSIPLPKSDRHSFILYRMAFRISIFMLLGSSVIGLLFTFITVGTFNSLLWVFISVLSAFFVVFSNIGTNWAIRKKQFKIISQSKIINSISSNGLKWLFGLLGFGTLGLLLGSLIGYVLSSLVFFAEFFHLKKKDQNDLSLAKASVLSKQYREFPLISLPHALIDMGRDLLVASLIIYFFSRDVFGSYSHSYAMLRLPLILIGTSIGQVFYNRCSEMINRGESIYDLLKRTMLMLFGLSIVPFGLLLFFGEELFTLVFGDQWGDSGHYSEIMSVWLMLNFVMSPVSNIPLLLKRQKEYFVMGLISTVIQLFGFGLIPLFYGEYFGFDKVLFFVSIGMIIYHLIVITLSLYYSRRSSEITQ
jgi:O-antigen/teichoic acid export membrane protein